MHKAPIRKYYNESEYFIDKINKKIILDSKFHNKLLLNKRKPFGYKNYRNCIRRYFNGWFV